MMVEQIINYIIKDMNQLFNFVQNAKPVERESKSKRRAALMVW